MEQREIKFRAWDTFNERMVDEPYLFRPSVEHDKHAGWEEEKYNAPFQYYEDWQDADDGINRPCFIMQYTGLKDKNGKEIYEGDIVSWKESECPDYDPDIDHEKYCDSVRQSVMKWSEEACGFRMKSMSRFKVAREQLTIIGNKFQNPELL